MKMWIGAGGSTLPTGIRNRRASTKLGPAQRGSLIISVMLLLAVTAALLTLYSERRSEHSRLERGEQVGQALAELGAGFNLYLRTYAHELAADQPSVSGVVNPRQPKAKELIDLLRIKRVAPVPPVIAGASYKFDITYPAGCSESQKLSEAKCRPIALAYIDKPLLRGGKVDYVALARAVRAMKGHGGYSRPESPNYITFPDGPVNLTPKAILTPLATAGVLAWRGDTLFANDEYLKTDGSNGMKATLRLDGEGGPHDLQGVRNITLTGDVQAGSLGISGHEVVTGGSIVRKNSTVEGNETVNGDLKILGSGLWTTNLRISGTANLNSVDVANSVDVTKQVNPNWMYFSQTYRIGGYCGKDREITMGNNGELLYCSNNAWKPINDPGSAVTRFYYRDVNFRIPHNYVYCRSEDGNLTLDYEAGGHYWYAKYKSSNATFYPVVCFGRYWG